ncbi:hypothetical protein PIROE2DRAFT_6726 [Piromyces sp. E2]|nr:hypothetical protein PIROE2DRAFT_6726 [Piromyces sp. E2]|eukprot:OUM66112.1 hypothetical protein PIROE2DRAFT_6726 [Piromyces sp. E2]
MSKTDLRNKRSSLYHNNGISLDLDDVRQNYPLSSILFNLSFSDILDNYNDDYGTTAINDNE